MSASKKEKRSSTSESVLMLMFAKPWPSSEFFALFAGSYSVRLLTTTSTTAPSLVTPTLPIRMVCGLDAPLSSTRSGPRPPRLDHFATDSRKLSATKF